MKNFTRTIEITANVTIITVAALLAVVLVKDHILTRKATEAAQTVNQPLQSANQISSAANLSSLDVDWKQNKQTLVLAISSACHFCTDSALFYQKLVQNKKGTKIIAVLPQSVDEGKHYLENLGVTVDEVRQLPLNKISVRGTPTLMLVDATGSVKELWIGKLSPDKEAQVLASLL